MADVALEVVSCVDDAAPIVISVDTVRPKRAPEFLTSAPTVEGAKYVMLDHDKPVPRETWGRGTFILEDMLVAKYSQCKLVAARELPLFLPDSKVIDLSSVKAAYEERDPQTCRPDVVDCTTLPRNHQSCCKRSTQPEARGWQLAGASPSAVRLPLVMVEGGLARDPASPFDFGERSYCAWSPCPTPGPHLRHTASAAAVQRDGDDAWQLSGIAPGAPLWVVQVLDSTDRGTSADALRGLARVRQWIEDGRLTAVNTVVVLNIQYEGAPFRTTKSCAEHDPCLARLVDSVVQTGAVVVAPSGNYDNEPREAAMRLPGCLPGVVSAAGHARDGVVASDQTTAGPDWLDFVAPGVGVVVYSLEDGQETRKCTSGSSLAAPAVGAALLRVMTDEGGTAREALQSLCDRRTRLVEAGGTEFWKLNLEPVEPPGQ